MSATALMGRADNEPHIKVVHKGEPMYYPLAADAEDRTLGGGDISTSTLESFSPSSVAGDPSLVSNELLAVMLWSNFQRGMATVKYNEQEGTGSLDSYAYATLDTRFEKMAILPPQRTSLGTLANNPYLEVDFLYAGRTATYKLVAWDTGLSSQPRVSLGSMNNTTGAITWTSVAFPATAGGVAPVGILEVVRYNGMLVATTDAAIYTSSNGGLTWTARWGSFDGFRGLAVHDNKLYTTRVSDRKLYWTLDPTIAPWPNSSLDPLIAIGVGFDVVIKIVEWKNRQDTRSLFILTASRIVAFDDDNYWATFFATDQIGGFGADMNVWPQDKSLYFSPYDNGANVMAFQNQTISNVSPNKRGGLSIGLARIIKRLRGNLNFLFAQGGATQRDQVMGRPYVPGVDTYGQIMAYNGQGWHSLAEGTATDPITSMALFKDTVIFTRNYRYVESMHVPDAPQSPLYYDGDIRYAEGSFYIESADADAGLENIYKTARFFEVVIEGSNGSLGLPIGHTYSFEWRPDDTVAWIPLAMNVGPGTGKYIRLPATTPTVSDARGVPFYRLRWKLTLTKSAGADATVTPILRSVGLYYLRAPDLIDGIQFAIDLSPNRVRSLYSAVGARYNDKTVEMLKRNLMAMKRSKYNPRIEYGPLRDRTIIPAAEIRVAARENPLTAMGQYVITARDVSTQTATLG